MEKWEVVRQDSGWFTIFKGQEQCCNNYGMPMRYGCYWKAKEVCDKLNQREKENKEDKYNVRYGGHFIIYKGDEQCFNDDGNPICFDDYNKATEKRDKLNNKMKQQENKKEQKVDKKLDELLNLMGKIVEITSKNQETLETLIGVMATMVKEHKAK